MRRILLLSAGLIGLCGFMFAPVTPPVNAPLLPQPIMPGVPELIPAVPDLPAPLAPTLTADTKRALEYLLSRA